MNRKCIKCGKSKELHEFIKNKNARLGFENECKKCCYIRRASNPIRYRNNKESQKRWYLKNKDLRISKTNLSNKLKDNGLYSRYWSMFRRCKYTSQIGYKYYGGKGITVEWKTYQDFKKDMYESYLKHIEVYGKRQTTLDRIDSDKNYCKENCRWATYKIQARMFLKNNVDKLL